MAITPDGKLMSAHQDTCSKYDPIRTHSLGVQSVKRGALYACKNLNEPTGVPPAQKGCFKCTNRSPFGPGA